MNDEQFKAWCEANAQRVCQATTKSGVIDILNMFRRSVVSEPAKVAPKPRKRVSSTSVPVSVEPQI